MSVVAGIQLTSINNRLGRWLLGSALAHLLIFIGWNSAPQLHGQRVTVLSVALDGNLRLPVPASRLENPVNGRPSPEKPPVRVGQQPTSATDPRPAKLTSRSALAADSSGRSPQVAAAQIHTRLLANLARHFNYPMMARLRGWEGTVLIGLDVEANGQLRQIHLARGSGYDVLDQSAIESVRRIERLQDASGRWSGQRHQIRLPVIYRLTER